MKGVLLLRERIPFSEDSFAELVLWQLPTPLTGSVHAFKYRLAFVNAGVCVVRFDNEAGKGDQCPTRGKGRPYAFVSPEKLVQDFVSAWKTGKAQRSARISFATPELLWKVLTAKRWEVLKAMCGAGPVTVREVARRVGRDVKPVHTDLAALLKAGVLDRTESGRIVFSYESVKVECRLQAA